MLNISKSEILSMFYNIIITMVGKNVKTYLILNVENNE